MTLWHVWILILGMATIFLKDEKGRERTLTMAFILTILANLKDFL